MNRKKTLADRVRDDMRPSSGLYARAALVESMRPFDLDVLANDADVAARGLVGAAARPRRMSKQQKKSGAAGAAHDKTTQGNL